MDCLQSFRTLLQVTIALSLSFSHTLLANGGKDVDEFRQYVGSLTSWSLMEGGGSRGSVGFAMGVGAGISTPPKSNPLYYEQVVFDGPVDSNSYAMNNYRANSQTIPRLWLHKGFSVPVDLAVSFSQIPNSRLSASLASLQWTVFEQFRKPTLAIRAGTSRLFGARSVTSTVRHGELVAGHQFLPWLMGYVSLGSHFHQFDLSVNGVNGTSLVGPYDLRNDVNAKDQYLSKAIGLQLQLLPQILKITTEYRQIGSVQELQAKLSFGI
jgi:hypothetical protein